MFINFKRWCRMKKKTYLLSGAITNIVFSGIAFVVCLVGYILLFGIESPNNLVGGFAVALTKALMMVIVFLLMIVFAVNIVLSSLLLMFLKKDNYKKIIGISITIFILDCIFVIASFFNFDLWSIIIMFCFAVAGSLLLIGIIQEHKQNKLNISSVQNNVEKFSEIKLNNEVENVANFSTNNDEKKDNQN